MRIAWISSWPPRTCGIAAYSQELVKAIRELGHKVYVICHTDGGRPGEKYVYPILNTDEPDWDEKLYQKIKLIKPDLIHIQHEYGLYISDNDYATHLLRPLCRWKIEREFPVVVTYHSIYPRLDVKRATYMDVTLRLISAGVVHESFQKTYLPENIGWVPSNVYVIPHGAKMPKSYSKEKAKVRLGIAGKKVVGLIGLFAPTKGYHRVIGAWDSLVEKLPSNTILILAGDTPIHSDYGPKYKEQLLKLVDSIKAKDKIKLILGKFTLEEYEQILSTFDLIVLPYTFGSQSGNLARAFSLGIPAVVSGLDSLRTQIELSKGGIAVPLKDNESLKRAIVTMMNNDELRRKCSERAREYVATKIGWPIIARKHLELYKSLRIKKN